ncbi:hypothetical protein ACCS53_39680, partial [Rhizobium ruizarguesonis]
LSLVVPIMTMSKIENEEVKNLATAIESGVCIAGYHGGACDAFRDSVDYQFIIVGACDVDGIVDDVAGVRHPLAAD